MDWENEASKARYRAILLARGLKTTPRHVKWTPIFRPEV
jgi:hypothetical protein